MKRPLEEEPVSTACEIEARLRPNCAQDRATLEDLVVREVVAQARTREGGVLPGGTQLQPGGAVAACVASLRVPEGGGGPATAECPPRVFLYTLADAARFDEVAQDDADLVAFSQWTLPCVEFEGLWESLVFEDDIKRSLLSYAESAMLFSDAGVDFNIVACNRVLLLHGPPGTGKTTILKGLAQKIAIRLGSTYDAGQFIEINAHSLFSKWFSESGKLVAKMFNKITEIVEDRSLFVCVLIDEVESLTAARQAAANGTEPSDAIRVVNALLTQLDRLKQYPNVLVMTTSNLTKAIDEAFVDRADICRFVGNPGEGARYSILASCVEEMMRTGLLVPRKSLLSYASANLTTAADDDSLEALLLQCARLSEGFSGRRLRKLPLLAFSSGLPHAGKAVGANSLAFLQWLKAAVEAHKRGAVAAGL